MTDALDPDLEDLPLMRRLKPATRARLLANAVIHSIAAGTVLFEQGRTPSFQHLMLSGSAHLFGRSSEGREVLIEVVKPPNLVVPSALLMGSPSLTQARVLEPSRAMLIQAAAFRGAVEQDPALARAVIDSLAGQYRRMVRQIKNLKLRGSIERVGCYILGLARQQGGDVVVLPYEKGLIASELGITRESFSRALAALQPHGIAVEGERITVLSRDALAAVSRPDPLIDPDEA